MKDIFITAFFWLMVAGFFCLIGQLFFGIVGFLGRLVSYRPDAERQYREFQEWQRQHYEANGFDSGMVPERNGKPSNPTIPEDGLSPLVTLWRQQRGQDKARYN